MNNKITIASLATLLSLKSGESKKTCESFLREFFAIVTEQIAAGDNVKVKGFGTFKVISVSNRKSVDVNTGEEIEIPGHKKIVFVPAKELAEEVNAPFSAFESVEVNPEAEAELDTLETITESEPEPEVQETIVQRPEVPEHAIQEATTPEPISTDPEDKAIPSSEIISDLSSTLDSTKEPEAETEETLSEHKSGPEYENSAEPIYFIADDEVKDDEAKDKTAPATTESDESSESEGIVEAADIDQEKEISEMRRLRYGRCRFIWGFLLGVSAAAVFGFLLYFFMLQKMLTGPEHDIDLIVKYDSVTPVAKDTVAPVCSEIKEDSAKAKEENFPDTKPSDRVIYDTVTTKCYLTTLAKKYYGNYNLWPYIYEENKAILGHPDRITPGTKVVIPTLSKYGVDPNSKEDISKAKKMGDAIYSRYR